jgi:hypothetical protein
MEYLKSLWTMLSPFREESLPLLSQKYEDLEAYGHAVPAVSDSIVLVCEIPEASAYHGIGLHHVRVNPFSENHLPSGLSYRDLVMP